jgi:hypothetical protein
MSMRGVWKSINTERNLQLEQLDHRLQHSTFRILQSTLGSKCHRQHSQWQPTKQVSFLLRYSLTNYTYHVLAFLDGKDKKLAVRDAPMPTAGAGRVVIQNHAVAVNPVDWKVQDYGAFVKEWPIVLGEDYAGEIVEVGEGVTHLKKGDRVTA